MSQKPSRAVSPEVATLFNRIDQQANEYEKAFADLDTFFRQAERVKRQVEEAFDKNTELYKKSIELFDKFNALDDYVNLRIEAVTKELREYLELVIVSDFENKTTEVLADFQSKTQAALGIMEGAHGIAKFLEDVKEFQINKDSKLNEINELLEKLKAQSEEIENAQKEHIKLVRYINFKMTEFENKINEKLAAEQKQYEITLANTLANIDRKIKEEIYNYLKNKS